MAIRVDFFKSNFDFNSRNRLDSTRFSISILEINFSRLSNRTNSNCQDSSRLIDSNSINRFDAISLFTNNFRQSTIATTIIALKQQLVSTITFEQQLVSTAIFVQLASVANYKQ